MAISIVGMLIIGSAVAAVLGIVGIIIIFACKK